MRPLFHVADQRRPFDDAWYTDPPDSFISTLDSVFLWTAAALACTDLILNGTLERHPDLRIGIVELSAVWVPMFLMMLDGGSDFTARLNGRPLAPLSMRPSDYFRRQVRVSSFSYELPARLIRQTGDLYMCCSDYPHSEGTATPLADYTGRRCRSAPDDAPGPVPRQRGDVAGARAARTLSAGSGARRERALEPQRRLDPLARSSTRRSVRTKSSS